jgi:DNA-binding NtrC family response regulator
LTQALLEAENARGGKQLSGFTSEALDQLASYDWPGNTVELIEAVREAHRQAGGRSITLAELPRRLALASEAAAYSKRALQPINLEQTLSQIETELIRRALAQAGGNKTRAAELLSMTRPRLLRRLAQLGLAGGSGGEAVERPVEIESELDEPRSESQI